MGITQAQKEMAEDRQWAAARDTASQIRLIAGPGTGKTYAIQKRVLEVLREGVNPQNVYVISFTRATCEEMKNRIRDYCSGQGFEAEAKKLHISTMHALGLSILRRGNQLNTFPCEPAVLDDWEQRHIYDTEFSSLHEMTPTRARRIRQAYDAAWQTLDPRDLDEAEVTPQEKTFFTQFHSNRAGLYSCLLPGEIIYKCVNALEFGSLQESQLPVIEHLIVDEYQDLNQCDQKFVKLLSDRGAKLFVAGDDDQSIYATLRHAHPAGIVHFDQSYPNYSNHQLEDCFRCTPAIVEPALNLISVNPDRVEKKLIPLYGSADPPVNGYLPVWSFQTAEDEARAVASSCQRLIELGMEGQESEIIILISDRKVQLDLLTRELANLGLTFDASTAKTTEDEAIRAAFCLLRLVKSINEQGQDKPYRDKKLDYPAYRSLVCLLHGVGTTTAKEISNLCLSNSCNYFDLFHRATNPHWLSARASTAVDRVKSIMGRMSDWNLTDTLQERRTEIAEIIRNDIFVGSDNVEDRGAIWTERAASLPSEMQLHELIEYFAAFTESEQEVILKKVQQRIGEDESDVLSVRQRKIRILTMHGAKGLAGKVVFIPSACTGIMPSNRALRAPGLVIEQRRLFYVSVTRAKAACIISHALIFTGAPAQIIEQRTTARLTRSLFLNDMRVVSVNRESGLTVDEAQRIIDAVRNLE